MDLWSWTPDGALTSVVSFCAPRERRAVVRAMRAVCKDWKSRVDAGVSRGTYDSRAPGPISALRNTPMIRTLTFYGSIHRPDVCELAAVAPPHLAEIRFRCCSFARDFDLSLISGLHRLVSVTINSCDGLADHAIAGLKHIPSLSSVDLGMCSGITDNGMADLARVPSLANLRARSCHRLTDAGVAELRRATGLARLDLRYCPNVASLEHLGAEMSSLNLAYCHRVSRVPFERFPRIRKLNLRYCYSLSDAGLSGIGLASQLRSLDVAYCNGITDVGAVSISGATSLTSLSLFFCDKITDAGVAAISTLSGLSDLDLGYCKHLTDRGLAAIGRIASLRTLKVRFCYNITDEGMAAAVSTLPVLSSVDVDFCFLLTGAWKKTNQQLLHNAGSVHAL